MEMITWIQRPVRPLAPVDGDDMYGVKLRV